FATARRGQNDAVTLYAGGRETAYLSLADCTGEGSAAGWGAEAAPGGDHGEARPEGPLGRRSPRPARGPGHTAPPNHTVPSAGAGSYRPAKADVHIGGS